MRKVSLAFAIISFFLVGLSGCSSQTSITPAVKNTKRVKVSDQFKINDISVTVSQLATPDIQYHTEQEIRNLVIAGIKKNLEQANLLTTDSNVNSLDIKIKYQKRFVGDETPFPSDSLAYPIFNYDIEVKNGDKVITSISKRGLQYKGGLAMNIKVAAGLLREKSFEIEFIDALSRTIAKNIEELKN